MTTSITTAVQIRSWSYWCSHVGCSNCLRSAPGVPARPHCPEHVTLTEAGQQLSPLIFRVNDLLWWLTRRHHPGTWWGQA